MNNKIISSVHWSFWVIGMFMLIWNIMGSMNFLWQVTADATELASFPEAHRAIIIGRPIWATSGFAIAVFIGALGCLLLLCRRSFAYYLFVLSLLGVVLTMIHTINIALSTVDFNLSDISVMILLPLVVGIFLIWYSKLAKRKGWIT